MRVMIDACVLYPTVTREILTGCAAAGLFQPRWSARVLEEWARATIKLGPGEETVARGEIALLTARFPQAMIRVPEGLSARLWLPDENDIHVLAAAVSGSCDMILTENAKDFPRNILAEEGLTRADPDTFLRGLHEIAPDALVEITEAVRAEAARLSGESWTLKALLKKARLTRLGKALERAGAVSI